MPGIPLVEGRTWAATRNQDGIASGGHEKLARKTAGSDVKSSVCMAVSRRGNNSPTARPSSVTDKRNGAVNSASVQPLKAWPKP